MFKEYDPYSSAPKNGKVVLANIAYVKFLREGMDGSVYAGTIAKGEKMITITIHDAAFAISFTIDDLNKVL